MNATDEERKVFVTSALVGLMGDVTATLSGMPLKDSMAVLDAVHQGQVSLVWNVEIVGDRATIKTEIVRPDGERKAISVQQIESLTLGGRRVAH